MYYWIVALSLLNAQPAARPDRETTADARTYNVPYKLTNTHHVMVRVKINDRGPYNFILDTGAPALFVSTNLCKKLDIKPNAQGWGSFKKFEIEGGAVIEKAAGRVEDPFQLEGMNGLGLAGAELHGIIGYNLLAKFRLEFDFTKRKMRWTPLKYNPPAPEGLGAQAAPAGMDAMASVMKVLGAFLGKNTNPEVALRGFLGIGLETFEDTVIVKAILAESPAAESGLKVGDRISHFQGKMVRTVAAVQKLAGKLAADETVELTVTRGAESMKLKIKAGRGL